MDNVLLQIGNMSSPLMMKPRETLTAFHLLFHPNTSHLHLATELRLATNASVFNIPIVVYNGKLKVSATWCHQSTTGCLTQVLKSGEKWEKMHLILFRLIFKSF